MRFAIALLLFTGAMRIGAQDLRFQHLTAEDGLSDNAITCVYEDRAGFIWVGTEGGLDRFDGQTVMATAIREHVTAVIEDRAGAIWVATRDAGLRRLDRAIGTFDTLRRRTADPGSIASDQLTALYDLDDTTLLIGSREVSLIFLDKRNLRFSYWTDSTSIAPERASPKPSPLPGWCHGFTVLDNGDLWINLLNHHLSAIADRPTGELRFVTHRRAGNQSICAAAQVGGRIYASGWQQGIDVLEGSNAQEPLHLDDEGLALAAWQEHHLLAGTRGSGLRLFDTRHDGQARTAEGTSFTHRRSDPGGLPSDRIRFLFVDSRGTLWVGTANGLAYHAPMVWRMHEHPLSNAMDDSTPELLVHRLSEDEDGSLRAFTSNGFYLLWPDGRVAHTPVLHMGSELQPTVFGTSAEGELLLGTEYGIAHWDDRTQRTGAAFAPFYEGGTRFGLGGMLQVRGLLPGEHQGTPVVHIATVGFGSFAAEADTGRVLGFTMPQGARSNNGYSLIHDMARDAHGRWWHASTGGLYFWEATMGLLDRLDAGPMDDQHGMVLPGREARQLIVRGDTVWALLRDASLARAIGERAEIMAPPAHLAGTAHGFAHDARGFFWIATDDGLLRFEPATSAWHAVPVNDGTRFRKLSKAIVALRDGRIAFCADNTIITFDPRAYDALPPPATACIIALASGGKELRSLDGQVRLPYSSPIIDVGVSALAHGLPRPLTFLFRLEGVEAEWRTLAKGEAIRYVGVPVGDHPLLVKSIDPYGRESEAQALLSISVAAPFWLTWWFYALAALVVSAGVYAWSRYRLAQALKLQAVRNRIASDLHDEVGSSLSSITIGSQLATQLSSAENEQVKQLMARIGETSSESLRSMSDIVWAIDPKNDEGEALVKRMQRIAGELLESKGVEVSFQVSGGVEDLKLPMNARKEIVLIYKEAVHNASKYSGASLVQVSLHQRNGSLAVSVKDDGTGFDPALHPDGHGLGGMRRRAELLSAELTLRSAPGMGTLVGLDLDLTKIRD